jgi:hypothetical protein
MAAARRDAPGQPDRAIERLKDLDVPRQTWLFAFCA